MFRFISPRAKIHDTAYLGYGVVILGPVEIGPRVIIEDNTIIGKPSMAEIERFKLLTRKRRTYEDYDAVVTAITLIERDCAIDRNVSIYSGSILREGVECEDNIRIGWDSEIGAFSRVMYSAMIYCRIKTGKHCRIGGFSCNDTVMGNYVSMFGETLHRYQTYGTEDRGDPAPKIEDKVTVSFGAKLIGNVTVGEAAYVAAGAIVTKDVPPQHVVTGVNIQYSAADWRGDLMKCYLSGWGRQEGMT